MTSIVFVYGTLRPSLRKLYGFYGDSIPHGKKICDGMINGDLYQLWGRVPALTNLDSDNIVKGEVVEYTEAEMEDIDQLESAYVKDRVSVTTKHGVIDAFVYTYNPPSGSKFVESGDWGKFLKDHPKIIRR